MAELAADVKDLLQEWTVWQLEERRRRWLADPAAWALERCGIHLWSAQANIMCAVRDHRRVAVKSCHEIGKTFVSALLVAWWLDTHVPGSAFAMTSAPTTTQVRVLLWREINRLVAAAELPGRTNQTEWHMPAGVAAKEELVAMGRKPDEYEPTAFQGIHAQFVLVVFDEATGISLPLWDAGDSLIANDASKFVAVGNPDDPECEFAEVCKPGSGWFVIEVGAFDTPAFTGEEVDPKLLGVLIGRLYVEEKRRKWAPSWVWVDEYDRAQPTPTGPVENIEWTTAYRRVVPRPQDDPQATNPLWQSKVLGLFPRVGGVYGLIPLPWIFRAQQRELPASGEHELGCDVGGGSDSSTVCERKGPVFRIINEDHDPDTMHTCGVLIECMNRTGAWRGKVDEIGIGKGVADRGKEQGYNIVGVNVSMSSDEGYTKKDKKQGKLKQFQNFRAEAWWTVRDLFENDQIDLDPLDEDLAGQLAELRMKTTSTGKVLIESKIEMKRRGVPSPNRADALMLAACDPPTKRRRGGLTWGR